MARSSLDVLVGLGRQRAREQAAELGDRISQAERAREERRAREAALARLRAEADTTMDRERAKLEAGELCVQDLSHHRDYQLGANEREQTAERSVAHATSQEHAQQAAEERARRALAEAHGDEKGIARLVARRQERLRRSREEALEREREELDRARRHAGLMPAPGNGTRGAKR